MKARRDRRDLREIRRIVVERARVYVRDAAAEDLRGSDRRARRGVRECPKVARPLPPSVRSAKVRKVLVDMHVAPATRRWGTRLSLALAVAVVIGYVPAQILARDPRVPSLRRQVAGLEREIDEVEQKNLRMVREIEALRSDIHTIESRARAELGMVYPNELVLRIAGTSAAAPAAQPAPAPSQPAEPGLAPL